MVLKDMRGRSVTPLVDEIHNLSLARTDDTITLHAITLFVCASILEYSKRMCQGNILKILVFDEEW